MQIDTTIVTWKYRLPCNLIARLITYERKQNRLHIHTIIFRCLPYFNWHQSKAIGHFQGYENHLYLNFVSVWKYQLYNITQEKAYIVTLLFQ